MRVFTDTWIGFWFGDRFAQSDWFYIGIYAGLGVFYGFTTFCRCYHTLPSAWRFLMRRSRRAVFPSGCRPVADMTAALLAV